MNSQMTTRRSFLTGLACATGATAIFGPALVRSVTVSVADSGAQQIVFEGVKFIGAPFVEWGADGTEVLFRNCIVVPWDNDTPYLVKNDTGLAVADACEETRENVRYRACPSIGSGCRGENLPTTRHRPSDRLASVIVPCPACLRRGVTDPNEATPPHECPYRIEINDDHETLCTCCKSCEQECRDDI